jgi:hypothetical protein
MIFGQSASVTRGLGQKFFKLQTAEIQGLSDTLPKPEYSPCSYKDGKLHTFVKSH